MDFWKWALLFRANGCGPITAHLRAWRVMRGAKVFYKPLHALDRF